MKLLGIIIVGFNETDQLLIISFAFIRYWRKMGVQWDSTSPICNFKKDNDSLRREVLYDILIKFGVPMKLVRLIKMGLTPQRSSTSLCYSGI
jgi:hypothetical protein